MILDHDANQELAATASRPKPVLIWTNPVPKRLIRERTMLVRKPILILFITVALVGTSVKAARANTDTQQRGVDTSAHV